jgi:hypothetical protein
MLISVEYKLCNQSLCCLYDLNYNKFVWWWVESKLGPFVTSAIYWPIVPAPGDCEDGEFGEMKTGRENRSSRTKPAPAPLYPPQIPLDQTRGSNPGRRGGKPATNRLSYGAALPL